MTKLWEKVDSLLKNGEALLLDSAQAGRIAHSQITNEILKLSALDETVVKHADETSELVFQESQRRLDCGHVGYFILAKWIMKAQE